MHSIEHAANMQYAFLNQNRTRIKCKYVQL